MNEKYYLETYCAKYLLYRNGRLSTIHNRLGYLYSHLFWTQVRLPTDKRVRDIIFQKASQVLLYCYCLKMCRSHLLIRRSATACCLNTKKKPFSRKFKNFNSRLMFTLKKLIKSFKNYVHKFTSFKI